MKSPITCNGELLLLGAVDEVLQEKVSPSVHCGKTLTLLECGQSVRTRNDHAGYRVLDHHASRGLCGLQT